MTADDVLLSVTSLSFDIAGLEIFLPLSVGARVVVADAGTVFDGVRLAALLARSQATVMQATPSTWRLLLDCGWRGSKSLKILCGGERLPRELANDLLERSAELWNLYGPTETTIWSTLSRVEPGVGPVSIGRPIANTQVYVLDPQLQPVPIGIVGELSIGGEGVARGYLNRPELTAEKFLPNPFGRQPDARFYRTGDRAKFMADGSLEFLGRFDHQIKIRGHRVELEEIESILGGHPAVRHAVVALREDMPGDQRLIAYFVPEPETSLSPGDLRRFLEEKLPEYALPSSFVPLETMPLTPSGKIDRKALPTPPAARPQLDERVVPPRTSVEETLAGIWCQVLGLPQVGVEDNFFELGGHSLRITQVLSRVRQAFHVELPFAQVFQAPTIAKMASDIAHLLEKGKDPITAEPEKRIIKRRPIVRRAIDL